MIVLLKDTQHKLKKQDIPPKYKLLDKHEQESDDINDHDWITKVFKEIENIRVPYDQINKESIAVYHILEEEELRQAILKHLPK
jgi:hypothetical protein